MRKVKTTIPITDIKITKGSTTRSSSSGTLFIFEKEDNKMKPLVKVRHDTKFKRVEIIVNEKTVDIDRDVLAEAFRQCLLLDVFKDYPEIQSKS